MITKRVLKEQLQTGFSIITSHLFVCVYIDRYISQISGKYNYDSDLGFSAAWVSFANKSVLRSLLKNLSNL